MYWMVSKKIPLEVNDDYRNQLHWTIYTTCTTKMYPFYNPTSFINNQNLQKQPPEVLYEKSILKNYVNFTGKYLRQSLFFNKVASLQLH